MRNRARVAADGVGAKRAVEVPRPRGVRPRVSAPAATLRADPAPPGEDPAVLDALDAAAVRRWAQVCVDGLAAHRVEIDRINVFPVADSDTGTNLLATMRSAVGALGPDTSSAPTTAAQLARGALLGARGNSGLVLSQVLRGFAESGVAERGFTGESLREALRRADELATASMSTPVSGTVLTVLHAAAEAARASADDTLPAVALAAALAAAAALARTPAQLAVLAAAGVVDAGGRGLVVVLDGLVAVVTGTAVRSEEVAAAEPGAVGGSVELHRYEVMYLLDGCGTDTLRTLRTALEHLGDCVVLAEDGSGTASVHVHCSDVGAAVEAGVVAGRPYRISVVQLDAVPPRAGTGRVLLVVVPDERTAALCAREGAAVLVSTPSAPVDAEAVLAVVVAAEAEQVTVLGNGCVAPGVLADVAVRARAQGRRVRVLSTASPVQGLAAIAVHDASRDDTDDAVAMAEAAGATRRGAVRVAEERGLTWVGECEPGDVLGLVDDDVVLVAPDQRGAATGLVDRMLGAGGELVTVLVGVGAEPGLANGLAAHLVAHHRGVELVVYPVALPADVLLLGVE